MPSLNSKAARQLASLLGAPSTSYAEPSACPRNALLPFLPPPKQQNSKHGPPNLKCLLLPC
jgi:hypothetical protein